MLARLRSALPPVSAADLLLFAWASGLVFGLAEGALRMIRRHINHVPAGRFTWNELLWMPPLAAVVALTLVAAIVIAADRVLRGRGLIRQLTVPAIITVGVHDVFVQAARLGVASVAGWILGLGCAVAFTRTSTLELVRRAGRWPLPLAMTGVALWAVGVPLVRQLEEQRARASLPPAAADAPNVLVVIWDTARALSLSLYGHTRRTTPALERFAQRGTVFERAFATSSWSLPSHASLYTGRYPHETNVGHSAPLDEEYPTLGEVLARRGYVTAGFTGNLYYGSRDFGMARGFSWYDDASSITWWKIAATYSLSRRVLARWLRYQRSHKELVSRPAKDINRAVLQWIDRRGKRPFYAFVNFFDAHAPYVAPRPFNVAFSQKPPRYWIEEPRPTDPAVQRELEIAYESSIRYLDHELGNLLAALERRGVLDNTLIILTSDHGEQFGDHDVRFLAHERSLYSSVLRVPLVVVYPPRFPAGTRRTEVVSIRDVPATVLDVAGSPGVADQDPFPGVSLLRYVNGTATAEEITEPRFAMMRPSRFFPKDFLEWATKNSHVFSLASGSLHYIVDASGNEELYDFVRDPWETDDLVGDRGADSSLARFRSTLDEIVPTWRHISPDTIAH